MLTNDIHTANLEELEVINNRLNEMHETMNDCFETSISMLHGACHLLTADLDENGLRGLHTIVMQSLFLVEKCYTLMLVEHAHETKINHTGSRMEA